jgi:DNA-binding CsgD family transcriptional regulator
MATAAALPPQPALLEREAEISTIQELVAAARGGAGRLLVIEGRAGMGKTRLVGVTCVAARAAGLEVLAARAGELEQEFAFGVVRQLFEPLLARATPEERAELTAGAAALALPLLQEPGAAGQDATDASFAMLHGLYWLAANLAMRRPALLAVDDLHWTDVASLRWIAYLARRLEGLPVLVAVATRPPEESPQAALVTEVLADPAAVVLRPGALGTEAVAALAGEAFAAAPDPAFVEACQKATGGNPLYLRALLDTLARERLAPTAANAARVLQTGPEAVLRAVSLRLARLPAAATALVRAAAVLGDGTQLQHAAALADLDLERAAQAATMLVHAGLLRLEDPLEFVHPVVRTAIYQQIGADERLRAHRRAAELFVTAGTPSQQAAAHLLLTPPGGDRFVGEVLRRAAEQSLVQGAPQAAVSYLWRALAEPMSDPERAELLYRLGVAEQSAAIPGAVEHLAEALALTTDPVRHAEMALPYAIALGLLDRLGAGQDALQAAIDVLGGRQPELGQLLEGVLIDFGLMDLDRHAMAVERIAQIREERLGAGLGAAVMRTVLAFHEASVGRARERCVTLAVDALDEGLLLRSSNVILGVNALFALLCAEEVQTATRFIDEGVAAARRRGDLVNAHYLLLYRGCAAAQRGDLREAEEDLRGAELDLAVTAALNLWRVGYLADVLVERGDMAAAAGVLESIDLDERITMNFRLPWLYGRARVDLEAGRLEQALAGFRTVGRVMVGYGFDNPGFLPWRSQAALTLQRLGRQAEALELAQEELERARRWGAPRTVGVALRALGLVQGGREGQALLGEAVAALRGAQAQVEHARALVDLGAALRRGNRRGDAQAPLRQGLELAYRAGATGLVRRAQEELAATGARPRKLVLTGVDALTASERRVARMAAEGMSNKELAQALFVTVKAVEVHLSSVYRKLQIGSRGQLAEALRGSRDASEPAVAPRLA